MRGSGRRAALVAALVAVGAALGPAGPAAADPARPGNVRSEVTGTSTTLPLRARVVGGDSFLELRVERGHEVVVLDYEGGDYLRFAADGAVLENRGSAAYVLNRTRYADGGVDPDRSTAPDWHRVAGDGTYAWHDHRVHWMSPTVAPETPWRVPVRVDGVKAEILGRYGPVTPPAAWPWWLLAAAALAPGALLAARRPRVAATAGLAVAALTAPVAVALHRLPAANWTSAALLVGAAVAALASLALRRATAAAVVAGAGVALGLWAVRRTSVFGHAVLVTSLPAWIDRLAVAVALGVGVGLVLGSAWLVTRPPASAPAQPEPAAA